MRRAKYGEGLALQARPSPFKHGLSVHPYHNFVQLYNCICLWETEKSGLRSAHCYKKALADIEQNKINITSKSIQ